MVVARLVMNIPKRFKVQTVANLTSVIQHQKSLRKMDHVNNVHLIQRLLLMVKHAKHQHVTTKKHLSLMVPAKLVLNILVLKIMVKVVLPTTVFLERKS